MKDKERKKHWSYTDNYREIHICTPHSQIQQQQSFRTACFFVLSCNRRSMLFIASKRCFFFFVFSFFFFSIHFHHHHSSILFTCTPIWISFGSTQRTFCSFGLSRSLLLSFSLSLSRTHIHTQSYIFIVRMIFLCFILF